MNLDWLFGGQSNEPMQAPPRNPARAPAGLENFAMDATVNPLWDVAKGIGAATSGYPMSPEAGAGLMAAMGMMAPGRMPIPRGSVPVFAAEKGLGNGVADIAQMLKQTGTNRQAFDQAMTSLEGLPKAQLLEIGQSYTGMGLKGLSSDAIKNEIVKGFIRDARFQNKIAPTSPIAEQPASPLMTSVDDAIAAIDAFLKAKK